MGKYDYFISCLKEKPEDDFYLYLDEIEAMLDDPLPEAAYKRESFWWGGGSRMSQALFECGFDALPDFKRKRIRFHRAKSASPIPPLAFATEKKEKTIKQKAGIPLPTIKEVSRLLEAFASNEVMEARKKAIQKLFLGEFKRNVAFEDVLHKCLTLYDFFPHGYFNLTFLAKCILSLNIDERLERGDPMLVEDIILFDIEDRKKVLYPFVTEYCSFHNSKEFPFCRGNAGKALKHFRDKDRFYDFKDSDLEEYPRLKNIFLAFSSFYGLSMFSMNDLSFFLFLFGEQHFSKCH